MKIIKPKMLNLKYEEVLSLFEGELTYIADFDCGNYVPYAVWRSKSPNRAKGHKDFVMIYFHDYKMYVAGRDRADIEKYLIRYAVHCHGCDNVIYSTYRHDFRTCECEAVSIDGGSGEYSRIASELNSPFTLGHLNLETNEFKESV